MQTAAKIHPSDVKRSIAYLTIVGDIAKVFPSACILTFYGDLNGKTRSFAYSNKVDFDTSAINESTEEKKVSDEIHEKGKFEVVRGKMSDYFTSENIASSMLVTEEKAFLEACGYSIAEGLYFAIPFPYPHVHTGIFFLFARNGKEVRAIKEKLRPIQNQLAELA